MLADERAEMKVCSGVETTDYRKAGKSAVASALRSIATRVHKKACLKAGMLDCWSVDRSVEELDEW